MRVADPKTTAGRAFVRSLNILLKFARLYGYEHTRTIEHLETAWRELRAAIPAGTEGGRLLGGTARHTGGPRTRPISRRNRQPASLGRCAVGRISRGKAICAAAFCRRPRERA